MAPVIEMNNGAALLMRALVRMMFSFSICALLSFDCLAQSGIISTVAGSGEGEILGGFGGDGGPAVSARLFNPQGVAVDTAGSLFIADTFNNRVRKVTPDGIINTVAGNGARGFSGDGGLAASAQLNGPTGVAVDSAGNLFIADQQNHRIRKVTPAGIISTVAGDGNTWAFPFGVAVDAAGNLFIANSFNVLKATPNGILNPVTRRETSGSRLNASAFVISPAGVAVDAAGNLFIASGVIDCIQKMTPDGIISIIAGCVMSSEISKPIVTTGVAIDSAGNVFFADLDHDRIQKITSNGIVSTLAGNGTRGFSGDGGPAASAQLWYPTGVAVDSAGNIFIADSENNRIRKVTPSKSPKKPN
jgi:sugar lactone lactonase YvrE